MSAWRSVRKVLFEKNKVYSEIKCLLKKKTNSVRFLLISVKVCCCFCTVSRRTLVCSLFSHGGGGEQVEIQALL